MDNLRGFASERLKALREQRGLQQTELARRAGVSREVIGKIERAETSPTLETLHRLCQVMRVSLAEFFTAGAGEKEQQAVEQLASYLATKPYEHIRLIDQLARLGLEQLEQEAQNTD